MKMYAIKDLEGGRVYVLQTNKSPEQFLKSRVETSSQEVDGEMVVTESVVMEQALIGEFPKDENGQYDIPDRYFIEEWREVDGTVSVDMGLAREKAMAKVRKSRDAVMDKIDAEWRKIKHKKSLTDSHLEAKQQELRDLPAGFDFSNSTLEEIKNLEPLAGVDLSLLDGLE